MTCIHSLIFLIIFPLFVFSVKQNQELYTPYGAQEVRYLVHKHQPTFAPCKYGVQMAFDQPHFVADPIEPFKEKRECCSICETLHITLPGTDTKATLCCLPETPYRHGLFTMTLSGGGKTDKNGNVNIVENMKLQHPLGIVFDDITPKEMDKDAYAKWINQPRPRVGSGAWAYIFIGVALAQIVVFVLVLFVYLITNGRIVLETVADCDYEIEQEIKNFNPSKSAMMSENMASDLMSMSQGAL